MKLKEKLWNWGHLEGSHNECAKLDCDMTPEAFAEEYGIPNAFIVSYGGNIQPPFDGFAERFSGLREIKWSVLGDSSTPLPAHELGNTEDILAVAAGSNITGGIVDDFFAPERLEKFPPAVLKKIRERLNAEGLDFWAVLYEHQLGMDISEYLDCFDGVTFWIWNRESLPEMDALVKRFGALVPGKKKMLGIYLWDYPGVRPMDTALFQRQIETYFGRLREKSVDGVIFCSGAIGDAKLETNRILKEAVKKYGELEI